MAAAEATFKEFFDDALVRDLAARMRTIDTSFDGAAFVERVGDLEPLPMKARVARISDALHAGLACPYPVAVDRLVAAFSAQSGGKVGEIRGFPVWVATHFVETQGLDHFEASIAALHVLTQRFTAEFAIRPFLVRYPERTLQVLRGWVTDKSDDVRRLVSEGTRPRLPWGMRLQAFMSDPEPVLELIAPLAQDRSEYVRRSVANNLNDIAKDNPDATTRFCERLLAQNDDEQTRKLVRHACRTLIKEGNADAMRLQGYPDAHDVRVDAFVVAPSEIAIGESVLLQASLQGDARSRTRVVVDYAIHFQKKSGLYRKVFKLSKQDIPAGQKARIVKRHEIRPVSIRNYYPGAHRVELMINGKAMAEATFVLRA